MARINNLTNFLTDVASAIKEKKGDSTNIPAEEFDIEILALSGGGNYQTKTLSITSNGTQIVTPDQDYDAIEQLTITTNVPIKSLQSKSYTFTTNQTMTLSPDTGYDGFSSVEVIVNVPSGGEAPAQYATLDYTGRTDCNLTYAIREISDLDLTGITTCSSAFSTMTNLKKVGKLKNSSSVTSSYSMFSTCYALTEVDLSEFDTSNITNMQRMFRECSTLPFLDLSNFNTSKVTSMKQMFLNCPKLETIIFGNNFTLEKCTDGSSLESMFSACSSLSNETLNEILRILPTFGGTENKKLTYLALSWDQATTCTGLSNWAACEAAGWTKY